MNKLFSLLIGAILFFTVSQTAYAAGESNCQIVYGGGEVCEEQVKFTINKLVQKPGKGNANYVENLNVGDPRYNPAQDVNFKIVIENTGDRDIENLNVTDTFPQFLTFVAGVGNTNKGASQINFIVGKLEKGKKVEYTITAKTADADKLPSNQAITCVINNVKAVSSNGSQAEDNSQLCIEKQVLGAVPTPQIFEKPTVKQIPATGPEMAALFGLIPMGAAGIYLRRKAE